MIYGPNYNVPTELSKVPHKSDVMDIQYNRFHDRILTSASNGSLNIYSVNTDMKLELDVGWDKVCSSAINGALFGEDRIVAVSDDGSILGIHLDKNVADVADIFDFQLKDCAAVTAVEQIDSHSFVTANAFGQLNLWDRREKLSHGRSQWTNRCSGLAASASAAIHCVTRHPAQPHSVATGHSGCVCLWDLRTAGSGGPAVQLNTGLATGSAVWRARFHPTRPQHLFVAAGNGGLIDICGRGAPFAFDWADCGSGLADLQMHSIIGDAAVSMTAMDVNESLVVAATDKEMLCVVPIGAQCGL